MIPATLPETLCDASQAKHLLDEVEKMRFRAFDSIPPTLRNKLGQFSTPTGIGSYMASLFERKRRQIRLLDPGAGSGSLTAAFVANVCARQWKPESIEVTAFEIDSVLRQHLNKTLGMCQDLCQEHGIAFESRVFYQDFIASAVDLLKQDLWRSEEPRHNFAILNPPYKKIASTSTHRLLLREIGIETSNLYAAFLALTILLLEPDGEMVAITPRSFCNGPYFRSFRKLLLKEMSLRHIHLFESRQTAFADDEVLQENIIFHAVKTHIQANQIGISTSRGPKDSRTLRLITTEELVSPDDPEQFIHISSDENGSRATEIIARLPCSLDDIGLSVSTGRVVDFRSRGWLRKVSNEGTVPLIHPAHFSDGLVTWPRKGHKKAEAYLVSDESTKWLIPAGVYVLTRRFSTKEERRRIVAALFTPELVPCKQVAFENHLNYFHEKGGGLPLELAIGLTTFLNSTVVDDCFRQFNGHTQVNAADLRKLRYPARQQLEELGTKLNGNKLMQGGIDRIIEKGLDEWLTSHRNEKLT